MDFSLAALWSQMGLFARFIVGVMAVMSVVSLFVAGERFLFFKRSKKDSMTFAAGAADPLSRGELETGFDFLPPERAGYLGRMILSGIGAYRITAALNADLTIESVARAVERQSQREVQTLKKGLSILATVAATAPFVGLLGTVMGIVNSFEQMAKSGSGGLGTVAGGISEALITTAFGLLVAIPAVMLFNYFQHWTDSRAVDLSESANEFLDMVAKKLKLGSALYAATYGQAAAQQQPQAAAQQVGYAGANGQYVAAPPPR